MNKIKDINNSIKLKNEVIDKNEILYSESNKDIYLFIKNKTIYLKEVIRNTVYSMQCNKKNQLFSNSDLNNCIFTLTELYKNIDEIHITTEKLENKDILLDKLQDVMEKLSIILCGFGTHNFTDLLNISLGSHYKDIRLFNELINEKIELVYKYIHPTGYKTLQWKKNIQYDNLLYHNELCSDKITDEINIIENSYNFECFDIDISNTKTFFQKTNGIRVIIHNEKKQKTYIISGIVDDIVLDCFSNKYIDYRKKEIFEYISNKYSVMEDLLIRMIDCITLKEILIYSSEDMYKKYNSILSEVNIVKQNKINITIKLFLDMDIYSQRSMLIHLFLYNKDDEIQYISYLLYDLITANKNSVNDSPEQLLIYDSLPWKIKMYFKDIMKFTIKYTQDMINKYDMNRISYEQQIYLMKVPEYIKEKAIVKLKEIKGKTDDSSIKAKQYLDALLKIPFGIFREEPILKFIKENNNQFIEIIHTIHNFNDNLITNIPKKPKYSTVEIMKYLSTIENTFRKRMIDDIHFIIKGQTTKKYSECIKYIQNNHKDQDIFTNIIIPKSKESRVALVNNYIDKNKNELINIYNLLKNSENRDKQPYTNMLNKTVKLKNKTFSVEKSLHDINDTLDSSIFGHEHAKNQILKIFAQWMNGEQSGYCFGFEGSPGVGKTSLAKKGLSNCLIDDSGSPRPFSFIALGGSSNGSTLEGHSYTYVNSTWGRIVDILMETKCMNPIIYIDELDKVSKTDHGKEIIGILTHLIDTTQNDSFQDKYFSGINLDLSKVLFIFSYNDPEQIDRILLDRIHRIRFDNLTIDDKKTIVSKYILPEINEKMGFFDTVVLSEDTIEYIIETYTMEPGVRKLKEVLFDLYGEINIELLKCNDYEKIEIPIVITIDNLDNKYLKKYYKIEETKIHTENKVGIINGLWANTLGKGGIIPIETIFFPTTNFLELKLTGLQGDVMKESMNVAKSLAWSLTPNSQKTFLLKIFNDTKCQGLHIHCPQGAVSKDGPSAGTAITIAIYSLFNSLKIKKNIAITGEINLQGQVTAIGGLESKILGGIRAGVKQFLYPKENNREFKEFMEKFESKEILTEIEFIKISNIQEAMKYVFE
jgi:ATP-dependent Lon protease